ncbi:Indoleamine 2,3-dioxygenase [Gautieria morchelliformis]|nr:Indoleamine 2,3-dioxygenase [Gautieria morchelliformis]
MEHTLPPDHFLSLPRPGVSFLGVVPDTSTLAAHDFDVDIRTGFMPPQPPLSRLPPQYEAWEEVLERATAQRLKLGERDDLTEEDRANSATWRQTVRDMPTLCTADLATSEVMLRRAHHVLTFVLHFYVHTLPPAPPSSEIRIPRALSVPLLHVCADLALPPVLTYSDNSPFSSSIDPAHLHSQTTFTGTADEEHFYLTSARIELAGVAALALLRSIQDEAFVGDVLALRRIAGYLAQLARVVDAMTLILNDVRKGCDPAVFYEQIRPWFRGQSSRPWVFEGADGAGQTQTQPTELAGPSAGQSSLIHVLDIFLGVDQFSHTHVAGGSTPAASASTSAPASGAENVPPFLERMQSYMPRHHRAFLNHLRANPRPLRDIVTADSATLPPEEAHVRAGIKEAYNAAVTAVKCFRDAHIRVATLYIITQARRVHTRAVGLYGDEEALAARGTGGTDLVPFLKGVRDKTAAAVLGT